MRGIRFRSQPLDATLDGDLDHVVHLLRAAGRKAERTRGAPAKPARKSAAKGEPAAVRLADEEFRQALLAGNGGRPARSSALRNAIKAHFNGRKDVVPDDVLRALLEEGWLTVDDAGRVTYDSEDLPF